MLSDRRHLLLALRWRVINSYAAGARSLEEAQRMMCWICALESGLTADEATSACTRRKKGLPLKNPRPDLTAARAHPAAGVGMGG